MIDIILVIYLCRRIKGIVEPKGYRSGIWQFYVVAAWFAAMFFGIVASVMVGSSLGVAALSGLLCAIGCTIAVQRRAQSLPDLTTTDKWLDNMGKHEDEGY